MPRSCERHERTLVTRVDYTTTPVDNVATRARAVEPSAGEVRKEVPARRAMHSHALRRARRRNGTERRGATDKTADGRRQATPITPPHYSRCKFRDVQLKAAATTTGTAFFRPPLWCFCFIGSLARHSVVTRQLGTNGQSRRAPIKRVHCERRDTSAKIKPTLFLLFDCLQIEKTTR